MRFTLMAQRGDSVAVRFADVSKPRRPDAGHSAYVGAVSSRLQEYDVRVSTILPISSRGPRKAELRLRPDPDTFVDPVPHEAFLYWDEENGWSLGLRRDPSTLAILNPVFKGLSVLPDPDDVAEWVTVLLTHPELTPSREEHPFRDHAVEDPEFEAQLARYAPGW
jgi:hypothetical protein